ncbi:hypothetical protein [Bradyrhizobium tunisiense]|uniref:hypothetical protein n=1 Tax=Bradyrhizobium tunisiense TaxID=3278709 RepID=UPI0035D7F526
MTASTTCGLKHDLAGMIVKLKLYRRISISFASANAAGLSTSTHALVSGRAKEPPHPHANEDFTCWCGDATEPSVIAWGAVARSCEQFIGRNNGLRECINICMRVVERQ